MCLTVWMAVRVSVIVIVAVGVGVIHVAQRGL